MNRSTAKLLTFAGIFGCLFASILLIYNAVQTTVFYFPQLLLFVSGIVLIVISLAYYTEK